MTPAQQLWSAAVLGGWVALWWLAIRASFGRLFGLLEWIPVTIAAFAISLTFADLAHSTREWAQESVLILGWGSIALAVDLAWIWRRWLHSPGSSRQTKSSG